MHAKSARLPTFSGLVWVSPLVGVPPLVRVEVDNEATEGEVADVITDKGVSKEGRSTALPPQRRSRPTRTPAMGTRRPAPLKDDL